MNKGFKRTKYGNLKTYNISDEEFEKNPNNTIIIKIKDKNKKSLKKQETIRNKYYMKK